jgi:hypothetical protein
MEREQIRSVVVETLDTPEFHDRLSDAVRAGVKAGMHDWGLSLGLNVENPLVQQADLQHLSRWRRIVESGMTRAFLTFVTVATTAFIGWIGVSLSSGWGWFKPPLPPGH